MHGSHTHGQGTITSAVGRNAPCVLVGAAARSGERTVIRLQDSTPGFTDANQPRVLVNMTNNNPATGSTPDYLRPNENWNQVLQAITLDLGSGNTGAVGVHLRAAQGSVLEDVEVLARDGLVGIAGGPGSGGAMVGVTVTGGLWSFDMRATQPAPTVTRATASSPACGALLSMSE